MPDRLGATNAAETSDSKREDQSLGMESPARDRDTGKPTRSILSKDFAYTPSHATDIRVLFRRIRREQRELEQARREQQEREAEQLATVTLNKRKTAK